MATSRPGRIAAPARDRAVLDVTRHAWLQVLAVGAALWIALTWATVETGNINLVPGVIALGAFLGPLAFVVYVYERARDVPVPALLTCFIVGGALGVTAAGVLEYRTVVDLHALPTLAVGLIEESCKLIVPLAVFALWRYRREADGLLIGVASGMGFAAFETMGYGMTMLLLSQGRIDAVVKLLFVRGVLAPAGHGAWTGFAAAMLWRARLRPGARSKIAFAVAFLTVVLLHAAWDAANTVTVQLLVGAASLALLGWRLQVATRRAPAL
jgi:RsiW-degrading membrane proteinase PrsW (M82 family)